jgi:hypothetical protein
MRADNPRRATQLMVHQESKFVAVAAEDAEAVGNADHSIAADGITDG